jgi:ribose 5-phosphate isomerase A
MTTQDDEKRLVGRAAVDLVRDGMTLGLGTGSTVRHFAEALAERVAEGLDIRALATSKDSQALAEQLGIPQVDWSAVDSLALCVDGADEVAADFAMTKGGGGALLWEKIVAAAAQRRVTIADSSKLVARLGAFPVPVEVCRFGHQQTARHLAALCREPTLRRRGNEPLITDSGNLIYDCRFEPIADPRDAHLALIDIPGVVESGLFVGMIDELIACRDGAIVSVTPADGAWWG